jgi:hypothetical protein
VAERDRQRRLEIFARSDWQMSLGEQAAIEGVVAQLSPRLAIEVRTAEGRSLECIASHSAQVHAVDLTDELLASGPANARFHKGDSKVVLPELLDRFASEARNVDLALAHDSMQRASQLIDGPGTPTASVTAPRIPLDAAHLGREPLQRELDAMHSSWSWRLTRLLRAVKVQLRGLTACRPRGSTDGRV